MFLRVVAEDIGQDPIKKETHRMNTPPQPSTYGQTAEFHRNLYNELLQEGYGHPDLLRLSLSKSLVRRYGSPEAVDAALGEGTYQGVKQRAGGLSAWRVAWKRVKDQWRLRYAAEVTALSILEGGVEACLDAKVSPLKVRFTVERLLSSKPTGKAS